VDSFNLDGLGQGQSNPDDGLEAGIHRLIGDPYFLKLRELNANIAKLKVCPSNLGLRGLYPFTASKSAVRHRTNRSATIVSGLRFNNTGSSEGQPELAQSENSIAKAINDTLFGHKRVYSIRVRLKTRPSLRSQLNLSISFRNRQL
jgi:hypothetical protein